MFPKLAFDLAGLMFNSYCVIGMRSAQLVMGTAAASEMSRMYAEKGAALLEAQAAAEWHSQRAVAHTSSPAGRSLRTGNAHERTAAVLRGSENSNSRQSSGSRAVLIAVAGTTP